MTIHGKFIGRLIRKPESAGPKKYGFILMALTLNDSDVEGGVASAGGTALQGAACASKLILGRRPSSEMGVNLGLRDFCGRACDDRQS